MAESLIIAFEQEEITDNVVIGMIFQDRKNPLEKYKESGITKRFRLFRESILFLVLN